MIPIGDQEFAKALVRVFRVDALVPVSDDTSVREFIESHKHLPWPTIQKSLFVKTFNGGNRPTLADLVHPVHRIYDEFYKNNPNKVSRLDLWRWEDDDPLADVLLASLGAFPSVDATGMDYNRLLGDVLYGQDKQVSADGPIPGWEMARDTIDSINHAYMDRDYVIRNHSDYPGFFVGHADDFLDLVTFWNLKAADIALQFFDPRYASRFEATKQFWSNQVRSLQNPSAQKGTIALWHREERPIAEPSQFGEKLTVCGVCAQSWNGLNIRPPIMIFSREAALASVSDGHNGQRKITFSLLAKPFARAPHNYDDRFVLSIDPGVGLIGNEQETLHAPYIPELNEFYGRNVYYKWNAVRAEPESLGVVLSAGDNHISMHALDVSTLIAEMFKRVGITAKPSRAGQICRTLIRQMGGLAGCRPFKIAGVRSLIEGHKPDQSFSRSDAMQRILGIGQGRIRPLSDYQWLYIEPRPNGIELKNDAVLGYLLDKGVFRPGIEFECPGCNLTFWKSLDDVTTRLECEFCGQLFNSSRQLRDKAWAFRRSGLFGRDDHQEGAIPVTLTLQQLTLAHQLSDSFYTTAMELKFSGSQIQDCETDFVLVVNAKGDNKIQVVIGECKTRGEITTDDVDKLRRVADAFPSKQYDVYIVFSKLSDITQNEIESIKALNTLSQRRAIILTEGELEPYLPYERTAIDFEIDQTAVSFSDMARVTEEVFFKNKRKSAS